MRRQTVLYFSNDTLWTRFGKFLDAVSGNKLNSVYQGNKLNSSARSFTNGARKYPYNTNPLSQQINRNRATSQSRGSKAQLQSKASSETSQRQSTPQPSRDGNLFVGLQTDFPCLLKNPSKGPEPEYEKVVSGYEVFHYGSPFYFKYNQGVLPELNIAYETWGELNEDKSNAIIIQSGLSASSHAKSHAKNGKPGWWEKFIGPGK